MSRGVSGLRERRRPRKWRLLVAYWAAQAAFIYLLWPTLLCNDLGELAGVPRMWTESEFAVWTLFAIVLVTAAQVAFVLPVRVPRVGEGGLLSRAARHGAAGLAAGAMAWLTMAAVLISIELLSDPVEHAWLLIWGAFGVASLGVTGVLIVRYRDGTPIGVSVAIAGFVSATLLVGVALGVVELWEYASGTEAAEGVWAASLLGTLVLGWAAATPLLLAFVRRGPRETRLERLAARLFLGSVVETVAIIPLDVMVRRRTTCYCGEGTFWSLVLCGSVGVLMLGPGVFFLLGRRRKRWLAGRCEVCEYDMSGCMDAERCPECGAGWRQSSRAARRGG